MLKPLARLSLRTTYLWITGLLMSVALTVSAALIGMTTRMHASTASLAAAVESVRLAEEIEIDLLLHAPTDIPRRGEDTEARLRDSLGRASRFVTTAEEGQVLRDTIAGVNAYLDVADDPGRDPAEVLRLREAATRSAEELTDINIRQSEDARASAARWNRLADAVGYATGALLLSAAALLLWWLRAHAFRPLRDLAAAIDAYGRGNRAARADESGPRELREIAAQFNDMAAALNDQRTAQMTFLGGVAHDVRNPLSALRLAVSALDRNGSFPEARTRRMLDIIGRQLTYLERMVGDFLDIAQIEAGRLELRPEPRDVRELVDGAATLFKDVSPQHPIAVDLPAEAVSVVCDPLRVEQVVINLLSNAIKYSPAGGEVTVTVARVRDEAVVAVRDRGVGVSDADRPRLFAPFSRVGLSKEAIPGAGLGLYVAQKIVQAHDGRIEVESAPGRGSTFRVILPAGAPAISRPAAARGPESSCA